MILTCPNCYIRYLLDRQVLEPNGRRVRCSACQFIWFQNPDDDDSLDDVYEGDEDAEYLAQAEVLDEDIPESVKPGPREIYDDLFEENRLIPVLTGVAAAALVFLFFSTILVFMREGIVRSWPPSAMVFEMAGFEIPVPGEGLIFDRVKAVTDFDQHGNEIIEIEGKIINLRDKSVKLPKIQARLMDEAGGYKQEWKVDVPEEAVNAEQSLRFATHYPEIADEVKQVQIGFSMLDPDQSE